MSKKLFVGGLSWNTTNESLRECFERFGVVAEAKVIVDRETGRSRGFGFVAYDDPAHAEAAIQQMDGGVLDSRTIRVNVAEERRTPARDGGAPRRPSGEGPSAPRNDIGRGEPRGFERAGREFPDDDDRRRDKKGRDRRGSSEGRGRGGRGSNSWSDDFD